MQNFCDESVLEKINLLSSVLGTLVNILNLSICLESDVWYSMIHLASSMETSFFLHLLHWVWGVWPEVIDTISFSLWNTLGFVLSKIHICSLRFSAAVKLQCSLWSYCCNQHIFRWFCFIMVTGEKLLPWNAKLEVAMCVNLAESCSK